MESKLNPILINSLLSLLTGLMLLWFFHTNKQVARAISDSVCSALAVAESPVEDMRGIVRAANNWVMERETLQQRNAELEKDNLRLREELMRLGAPSPAPIRGFIDARVTLRYPESWWSEVRVDKGEADGVVAGAPALCDGYMVGRVTRTGANFAWVELVTASTFLLAAVVKDTWDLGVVNGDGAGGIWLLYAPSDKEYKRGMEVSTALVGDYLPPGIPIGTIWGTGEERDGHTPRTVVSGAHLTQLYTVQILRSGEGASPK